MERNTLMAKCYPKIKDYCREKHGLEFQVSLFYFNPPPHPPPGTGFLSLRKKN